MNHVVIIGNGVAGITAARHIRKLSDHRITVVSYETDHHFSRTALMYVYMGHMRYENLKPYEDRFWEKNRIDLVRGYVEQIEVDHKALHISGGRVVHYDDLIIATGSRPNKFGWPGQDLEGVQGLYSWQDLESMERNTKEISHAVVVGGGLIGIEVVEMLRSRHIPVTFLVRERSFWDIVLPPEESRIVSDHIREHHVDLRLSTELAGILPDENGRVRAVVTNREEEIPCEFVALTVGVGPNIEVVRKSKVETSRGVLVNEYFETDIPHVYAIGDCAEFREPKPDHPRIEQLWYTGKMHGEVVARTICGMRTRYDRGAWFNSAKFLDLEYQTYGIVHNHLHDDEETLCWEHPDGRKCIRINYLAADRRVVGFNLIGIRYRHEVCSRWLHEERTIEYVLEHLGEANFDPEFVRQHEAEVTALYNRLHPERPVTLKRKRGLFSRMMG